MEARLFGMQDSVEIWCVCYLCVCVCDLCPLIRSGLERGEMQTFYHYLINSLFPRHLGMELAEVSAALHVVCTIYTHVLWCTSGGCAMHAIPSFP